MIEAVVGIGIGVGITGHRSRSQSRPRIAIVNSDVSCGLSESSVVDSECGGGCGGWCFLYSLSLPTSSVMSCTNVG